MTILIASVATIVAGALLIRSLTEAESNRQKALRPALAPTRRAHRRRR